MFFYFVQTVFLLTRVMVCRLMQLNLMCSVELFCGCRELVEGLMFGLSFRFRLANWCNTPNFFTCMAGSSFEFAFTASMAKGTTSIACSILWLGCMTAELLNGYFSILEKFGNFICSLNSSSNFYCL